MYVCVCKSVTHAEIVERVRAGTGCFDELQFETGVASCCGRCEDTARSLVADTARSLVADAARTPVADALRVSMATRAGHAAADVAHGHCACCAAPGAECSGAAAAGAPSAVGSAAGASRVTTVSRRLPISARSM